MPKKFVGIPSIFQEVWGNRTNLCITEAITYFHQKFSISQCGNTSWASLQCFRKFGISKKFIHNRGYQVFLSKNFLSHLPEKICKRIPLFLREFLVSKSFYGWKMGGYHIFPSRNFGLTEPKNFVRELPCNVLQKLWCRKNLCIIGVITFSVKNFRSHSAEKIRGHPFNVSESLG